MQKLLSKTTVSASDRKLIDSVSASIEKLNSVIIGCRPSDETMSTPNWRSKLHLAKDAAYAELTMNPTESNAEKFHAAFVRNEQSKLTSEFIGEALDEARRTESAKLAGVVANVIDAAEAKVDSEAAAFRKSLCEADKSNIFSADVAAHDARVLDMKRRLADARVRASGDPYQWLEAHGLIS